MIKNCLWLGILAAVLTVTGCAWNSERLRPNYYVLEYREGNENPALRMSQPFPQSLEVLDAERNLFNMELTYIQTKGAVFRAMVNLYKSMGGGWDVELSEK